MKLSKWVPITVTGVIALGAFTNAYISFSAQQKFFFKQRMEECKRVIEQTRSGVDEVGNQAAAFAVSIANSPSVIQKFEANDRQATLNETEPLFKALKERYQVQLIQFHYPQAVTFLRVHKPEHYGDDLKNRELVVGTNLRKTPQYGVEAGSSGVAIRGIAPIKSPNKHVGTVETGLPFQPVLDNVRRRTGFDLGIYVQKEKVEKTDGRLVGGFKEVALTDGELMEKTIHEGDVDIIQDEKIEDEIIDGSLYTIVRIPLLDVSNHNIGTIVGLRAFPELVKAEKRTFYLSYLLALFQTILGAGVVAAVFNGLVLKPLKDFHGALTDDEEDDEEQLKPFLARTDEIGEIARLFEGKN